MKKLLILLIMLTLSLGSVLNAENEEWGAWFKASMKNAKEYRVEPHNWDDNINLWRYHSDEIFKTFKHYRQKLSEGIDITQEQEIDIVPEYYFDGKNTEEETNRAVEFYIYAFEHAKKWLYRLNSFRYLIKIAYHGNEKAKEYVFKQKDNFSLQISLRLRFTIATLFWGKNENTLSYLMQIIKKAQEVETTNLKYSSPNESAILSALKSTQLIPKLYKKGEDYTYVLPLIKQMIFSRSRGIQISAVTSYYFYTNKAEMKKIYRDCWAKVHDKNTSRKEFLNALYGLQALYALQQSFEGIGGEHRIGFKGILGYFWKFGGRTLIKGKGKWLPSDYPSQLTNKEKKYFQDRLRSK